MQNLKVLISNSLHLRYKEIPLLNVEIYGKIIATNFNVKSRNSKINITLICYYVIVLHNEQEGPKMVQRHNEWEISYSVLQFIAI